MATTYTLISSVTVGSGGAQYIDFTSIPSTYTDLVIKASIRNNGSFNDGTSINFNGDTSNNTGKRMYGSGSSVATDSGRFAINNSTGSTADTFTNMEFYIPNYTSSNYKSWSADSAMENNGTTAYFTIVAGLWSSAAAITSIRLLNEGGSTSNLQYTTAYLYGISNA
jgi:hypothetical protein